MKAFFHIFLLVVGLSATGVAQNLVAYEHLQSLTAFELLSTYGIPVPNGVHLYKILYKTPDTQGVLDTASGLMVVPDLEDTVFPVVTYQHGTTSPRLNVPSRLRGHEIELFFGANGSLVSSTDMLGMGDARGFHPYLHAATQASAAIDLLRAVKEVCALEEIALNEQLFVAGYSQGGHAAMATFKALEENYSDEFPVTAAAPMSGPYNVTGTMQTSTLRDEEYFFPAYLVYIARGMQAAYGNLYTDLSELFKSPYVELIRQFDNQEAYPLGDLNQDLITLLTQETGASVPRYMMQDDVVAALLAGDTSNPMFQALADNNLYDWIPNAPMRMFYCEADEQVAFENAIFTDSIMNANGAADVRAMSMGENLDHAGCAIPAIFNADQFFKSFVSTTATKNIVPTAIAIFPNPVGERLHWAVNDYQGVTRVTVLDELGRAWKRAELNGSSIELSNLPTGMYFLRLEQGATVRMQRFVKE